MATIHYNVKYTIVAIVGDRLVHSPKKAIVPGNGENNLSPFSVTIVASVDEALSPHFAAPPDCRLG